MSGEPAFYNVSAALTRLGLEVEERDGEGYRRCPGHYARTGREDSSPSWSINLTTGLHHCFSCGYGGSLEHLVSGILRIDHHAAEAWLADPALLAQAIEARLKSIQRYNPPSSKVDLSGFTLPPPAELAKRRITIEAALRYEILWDGKGFILPIRDPWHRLLGYQIKRGSYVRNRPLRVAKATTLFGLGAYTGSRAILVESPLDCARLWSAGIDGAVASFGSTVSDKQVELLIYIADRVVIALDDDNAGEIGADAVETALNHRANPIRRFEYRRPCGKDPGELDDDELAYGIEHARTRLERLTAACHVKGRK